MVSAGANIVDNMSALQKVTVKYVYDSVRNPRPNIASQIRQLRIIRGLDNKQYNLLKRRLPYLVCAIFSPPCRKTENFAYTEYFIVDIDHVTDKQFSMSELRSRIEADSRVLLSFLSPGEDGLKVMFRLKERCYDSGLYSLFYKSFVNSFSQQYGLQQVIDRQTCDVSRACFISMDADAYYNPHAEAVDMRSFLPMDNPYGLFELKRKQEEQCRQLEKDVEKEALDKEPDKQAMAHIRELLHFKVKKKAKPVFVPQVLNDIMDDLIRHIESAGVSVAEVRNIQYGKKMRFTLGLKRAELNLFFGKKGFSVVCSPRTGTDSELNQLMVDWVSSYINGR